MSEPHEPVYTLMACTNCQRGYRVRDMYETEEGLVCEGCYGEEHR